MLLAACMLVAAEGVRDVVRYYPDSKIKDITDQAVLHVGSQTKRFRWTCKAGDKVRWDVAQPSAFSTQIAVRIEGHDPLQVATAATSEVTRVVQNSTTFTLHAGGCPIRQHRDRFTSVRYKTLLRYAGDCDPNTSYALEISSPGNVVLITGSDDEPAGSTRFGLAPYDYAMSGGLAGFPSPWWYVLIAAIVGAAATLGSNYTLSDAVHPFIAVAWVIFIATDFFRYLESMTTANCDAININGDHQCCIKNGVGNRGGVDGFYVGRLLLSLLGLATITAHDRDPVANWYAVAASAVVVAAAGFIFSVGGGLLPFIVLVYYVALDRADYAPATRRKDGFKFALVA